MKSFSSRRRGSRITGGELRLTLLAGAMLGLIALQIPGMFAPTTIAPAPATVPGAPTGPLERPEEVDPWAQSERVPEFARIDVIDGDTFRYGGETIRIADIDTPETHPPRCAHEAELGARATRRLHQLLSTGGFELQSAGDRDTDRYGRKLRIVVRDGRSVGGILVAEGLAREWEGRRRPWCD